MLRKRAFLVVKAELSASFFLNCGLTQGNPLKRSAAWITYFFVFLLYTYMVIKRN